MTETISASLLLLLVAEFLKFQIKKDIKDSWNKRVEVFDTNNHGRNNKQVWLKWSHTE